MAEAQTSSRDNESNSNDVTASGQVVGVSSVSVLASSDATPSTGKRQAFRDLRRQLTEAELASPGVQKLLLESLERADADCDRYMAFEPLYYAADKRAAILDEKLRTSVALEVAFGFGVGVGCAAIGIAASIWDQHPKLGIFGLTFGAVLVLGGIGVRVIKA